MSNGFGDMFKQAQQVQEDMKKKLQDVQDQLSNLEVVGESGAGMVKVTMNGRHDVKAVKLDPALMTEDKTILEDLLAAAVNDAVRKVEKNNQDKMANLGAGFNLPEAFNIFKR